MVMYSIIRSEKLKSDTKPDKKSGKIINNIDVASAHNNRKIVVENADGLRTILNETLVACHDYRQAILEHTAEYGVRIKSTSVWAQELVLSASPEYFRPSCPEKYGYYEEDLYQEWKKETFNFLKNKYGVNLIACEVHMDEATPHMHAIVVPITPITKDHPKHRLSARVMFSEQELVNYHTEYAKAVKHLGLERGIEKSAAKHQKIKEYYGNVNSPMPSIPTVTLPSPAKMLTKSARQVWVNEQNKIIADVVKPIHDKASQSEFWKKRAAQEKAARQVILQQLEEIKKITAQLKDINLSLVLERLGYTKDLGKHSISDDQTQYRQGVDNGKYYGDRISVKLSEGLWTDHTNNIGGKGSIDLVMHVNSCTFIDAKSWMIKEFGIDSTKSAAYVKASIDFDKDKKNKVTFAPPIPVLNNIKKVMDYLIDERKLSPIVVGWLVEKNRLYADNRNNACFIYGSAKQPAGVELCGTTGVKFKGFRGEKTSTFSLTPSSNTPIKKIAVCESAIEAISYVELYPDHRAVSISGVGNHDLMKKIIDLAKKDNLGIVIALNNDRAGEKATNALVKECEEGGVRASKARPWGDNSDWNDNLKSIKIELERLGIEPKSQVILEKQILKSVEYKQIVKNRIEKNSINQARGIEF